MSTRKQRIQHFGTEIVEEDERIWRERGYLVDKNTGLLVKTSSREQFIQGLIDKNLAFGWCNGEFVTNPNV